MYDRNKTLRYSPMLTRYIHAAMRQATYELLEDGTFYGEIPPCKGLWSNADSREELQDSLEEWIILGLRLGHRLPGVDNTLPQIDRVLSR